MCELLDWVNSLVISAQWFVFPYLLGIFLSQSCDRLCTFRCLIQNPFQMICENFIQALCQWWCPKTFFIWDVVIPFLLPASLPHLPQVDAPYWNSLVFPISHKFFDTWKEPRVKNAHREPSYSFQISRSHPSPQNLLFSIRLWPMGHQLHNHTHNSRKCTRLRFEYVHLGKW